MLLGLLANGSVIYDGPPGYARLTPIDRDGRIHKVPTGIAMSGATLGELTRGPDEPVLMAFGA
jgi:hypothetical protein